MAFWEEALGGFFALLLVAAIFIPIERKWPLIPRKFRRKLWKTDVLHVVLTGLMDRGFAVVGIVAAWLLVGWWAPAGIAAVVNSQPYWLMVIESLFLGNLIGYWSHRLTHTVPILWRFHKIHHSPRHMDWLAGVRHHPLEQAWGGFFIGVPLIFIGFQFEQVALIEIVNGLWGVFLHSNTRLRFKRLRYVVATPEYHHWHHSADPQHYNTNYSLFPWIDKAFGTYHQPNDRAMEFGVPDYDPRGYVSQMIEPFRRKKPMVEFTET